MIAGGAVGAVHYRVDKPFEPGVAWDHPNVLEPARRGQRAALGKQLVDEPAGLLQHARDGTLAADVANELLASATAAAPPLEPKHADERDREADLRLSPEQELTGNGEVARTGDQPARAEQPLGLWVPQSLGVGRD